MTYLEKYMQEHPDNNVSTVVMHKCPGDDYLTTSPKCLRHRTVGPTEFACMTCWNQEIPGTGITVKENNMSNEEKAKLAEFVAALTDEELGHLQSYLASLHELSIKKQVVDRARERFVGERKDV